MISSIEQQTNQSTLWFLHHTSLQYTVFLTGGAAKKLLQVVSVAAAKEICAEFYNGSSFIAVTNRIALPCPITFKVLPLLGQSAPRAPRQTDKKKKTKRLGKLWLWPGWLLDLRSGSTGSWLITHLV